MQKSRTIQAQILGIGTAVPEFHVEQADAAQQASQLGEINIQQQQLLKELYLLRRRRKTPQRSSDCEYESSPGRAIVLQSRCGEAIWPDHCRAHGGI